MGPFGRTHFRLAPCNLCCVGQALRRFGCGTWPEGDCHAWSCQHDFAIKGAYAKRLLFCVHAHYILSHRSSALLKHKTVEYAPVPQDENSFTPFVTLM